MATSTIRAVLSALARTARGLIDPRIGRRSNSIARFIARKRRNWRSTPLDQTWMDTPPGLPWKNERDETSAGELLAASRLTGADVSFLHAVEVISTKLTGSARVTDPAARAKVELLHAEFREACAAILEKHLGRRDAVATLRALESAAVQRYLAARQAMAPAWRSALQKLEQRMVDIEI